MRRKALLFLGLSSCILLAGCGNTQNGVTSSSENTVATEETVEDTTEANTEEVSEEENIDTPEVEQVNDLLIKQDAELETEFDGWNVINSERYADSDMTVTIYCMEQKDDALNFMQDMVLSYFLRGGENAQVFLNKEDTDIWGDADKLSDTVRVIYDKDFSVKYDLFIQEDGTPTLMEIQWQGTTDEETGLSEAKSAETFYYDSLYY